MTESENQILVMCWAKKAALNGRSELDLLAHIPNGGSRGKSEGARFKAMGVKAGMPDLILPVANGEFNNLWIEMKVDGGKLSPEQQNLHQSLSKHGGNVVVAWNWRDAIAAICDYLGGEWPDVDMNAMESRLCR